MTAVCYPLMFEANTLAENFMVLFSKRYMNSQLIGGQELKIKVSFFDRTLRKDYWTILSIIAVVFTLGSIFISIPNDRKLVVAIMFLCVLLVIYIIMWIRANLLKKMKISINNSVVEVRIGNIFEEEELKVIAFNEYFDTLVDNVIISERTLNGMFIKNVLKDVAELDTLIENDEYLSEKISGTNQNRRHGKKNRYKLGTIFKHNDYLLTAFTKFDDENRAFLSMNDYVNFLLNFWNEVDIIYNGRSVSIPLLGSGITRFKEYNSITDQELLELLIWSFKISRIKFTYPSKASIIIHDSKMDKINFYKLKELAQ